MMRIHPATRSRPSGFTTLTCKSLLPFRDLPRAYFRPFGISHTLFRCAFSRTCWMQGPISHFWGKFNKENQTWHPLQDHCADVAACCEALLTQTVLPRRLEILGNLDPLSKAQIAQLSVLAALHDVGKFNLGFQGRLDFPTKIPAAGHVREIVALLGFGYPAMAAAMKAVLPTFATEGRSALLLASICHHGFPVPIIGNVVNPSLWHSASTHRLSWGHAKPLEGVAELVARLRRWFPEAFEVPIQFPELPVIQHWFAGLVTLADWIGSNVKFFPYSESDEDRMIFARPRAQEVLERMGLDPRPHRSSLWEPLSFSYQNELTASISSYEPTPAQKALGELPLPISGSLTILEEETGSGKTEAAVYRFFQLYQAGLVDGLYFALPTRVAATQIHQRIREIVERVFQRRQDRPAVVLAVPGYLQVDDQKGRKRNDPKDFEVDWPEGWGESAFRGWAAESPQRFLGGSIVIGTIDQVLLSTLQTKFAHMRSTALGRHFLVVDEVHASDLYMRGLLEQVLIQHLACGSHALLMSATLGSGATAQFTHLGASWAHPPLGEAISADYPKIIHQTKDITTHLPIKTSGRRASRSVMPEVFPIAEDALAIAQHALNAARRGARVLVVRNLVRECVATQEALESLGTPDLLFHVPEWDTPIAPHHARFARSDRKLLDQMVEYHFGPSKMEPRKEGGRVLVATQTVEQSLDIDADYLLTDLCPMDVLLQRVGRLHRHVEHRPEGFKIPRVGVLTPRQRDWETFVLATLGKTEFPSQHHGYGLVYRDLRSLEATWRMCETRETFELPRDNRTLVEEGTHPESLSKLAHEPFWRAHVRKLDELMRLHHRKAQNSLIDLGEAFGVSRFSDGSKNTRLGAGERMIRFDRQRSPFGKNIWALFIPQHLLRGDQFPDFAELIPMEVVDEGLLFSFGKGTYRYDRHGLRLTA